jgi:hypothetical protein
VINSQQPNKITQLQTTWTCLWLARPTQTISTWLIGCMEGSMALLWINRWIGHITQTKHHDTRLENRARENVEWVKRKGLACKMLSRNFRSTYRFSHHHEASYPGRCKTTSNGCNTYYYSKRFGVIMWSMYAWHGNYDAIQLIEIKQNRNPDTYKYGSSCFTTQQFNLFISMEKKRHRWATQI